MKFGRRSMIGFIFFFLLPSVPFLPVPHSVAADTLSSVYVTPVQTCCILPTDSSPVFTVNVMMNLNGAEPINGFDIRLNYSNFFSPSPPAHGVVKAFSLDYSNNIFVTDGYPMTTLASCIDDVTFATSDFGGFCATDDVASGQVHVAEAIQAGSSNPTISGPLNNALLFSVTFAVNATGTSLFYLDRAGLSNPGGLPGNPHYIPVVTSAGVFGNAPLVAFFDYTSTLSPSVLSGVNARFDAGSSFRSTSSGKASLSSPTFTWNFGDGITNQTSNPVIMHSFHVSGNYTVGLVVNDTSPGIGSFSRVVRVVPPLGGLHVSVRNAGGGFVSTIVTVKLHNFTSPVPALCTACTQTINAGGTVDFRGLTPGIYTFNATGPGVDPVGKQTQVQVGWTTMETVYMTEAQPPDPNTIFLEIFGAVMAAGLGAVGLALFVRWRRSAKLTKAREAIRKTRKPGRP